MSTSAQCDGNGRNRTLRALVRGAAALGAAAIAAGAADVQVSTVPAPREDPGGAARQAAVLERARTSPPANVVFIGDSITQSWEAEGSTVWRERIEPLGAVNLGVGGDRTEHVLWRLSQAPLSRLNPKAVVIMIGTNNIGHGRDGAAAALAGVRAVVALVRAQAPAATVILCGILPRGAAMNAMRGELLQVNQALVREFGATGESGPATGSASGPAAGSGGAVRFLDFGVRFIDVDGKIPTELMPDALHLSPKGYAVWADAIMPHLTLATSQTPATGG
ncbi:MAG: GDSL family lipase [Phycisphaerales bacterium]|nr:GDSL family lipase [Phycisphaerales bacterium]